MTASDALAQALARAEAHAAQPEALRLAFALACVERVVHLLEDPAVVRCVDTLRGFADGSADRTALETAAAEAASLANRHQGSRSLDGVGHAAVSASYAVAKALAGQALQAAEYAAYAAVYGSGGYGAVSDPASFTPEREWQLAQLEQVAQAVEPAVPPTMPR